MFLGSRKENAGIGGIIKPPRLTKQVGTTSLKSIVPNTGENAAVIRPKRTRSGEKIPEESKEDKMEVEPTKEEAAVRIPKIIRQKLNHCRCFMPCTYFQHCAKF